MPRRPGAAVIERIPERWRAPLGVAALVLQSLALAVATTWPAVRAWDRAALGTMEGDAPKHLWNLWWMRRELAEGAPGLRTAWVNFPDGMEVFPIEPLNGLLAWVLPLDPVPLSNLLALGHVTLLGLLAGWLGGLVSGRWAGAYAAGALAQCAAFTGFALHVGVGELRQVWLLPLGLGLQQLALRSGLWGWYLATGAAVGLTTIACLYHGFFLALAVLAVALSTMTLARLPRWVVAGLLAILLVAVPVRVFAASWSPAGGADVMSFAAWMEAAARTPLETFPLEAAQVDELVTPRGTRDRVVEVQARIYGGGRYLGLVALLLAGIGVAAHPRRAAPWVVAALAGAVLAFGTVLWLDGEVVRVGGARVVLPLAWLNRVLGWVAEPVNFPARFLVVPMIALAVLGALATRWRAAWVLVPLACADIVRHDQVPWPRRTFTLPEVGALAGAAGPGAVADLTPFAVPGPPPSGAVGDSIVARRDRLSRTRAIAAQLVLSRPFDSMPVERMDYWATSGIVWLAALPLTAGLGAATLPADPRPDLWLLRDRGFDRLLLTHAPEPRVGLPLDAALTALLGEPVRAAEATVWRVPEVLATEEEAARWREEQAARVGAAPSPRPGAPNPR